MKESEVNKTQVAGNHYQTNIQHWDYVVANELDYFQAQVTKYATRCKRKNGLEDLKKAQHFLSKYIELVEQGQIPMPRKKTISTDETINKSEGEPGSNYVDQG